MSNRYEEAARKVVDATNAKYASEISSLTSLKDDQINQLFPTCNDKDKLLELLTIVNAGTSENERTKKLMENIETLGGTVIRLIKILA